MADLTAAYSFAYAIDSRVANLDMGSSSVSKSAELMEIAGFRPLSSGRTNGFSDPVYVTAWFEATL